MGLKSTEINMFLAELGAHLHFDPDEKLFRTILENTVLCFDKEFSDSLPEKNQTITQSNSYTYISLRRIISNEYIKLSKNKKLRHMYNQLISYFTVYSSTKFVSNIKTDKGLIDIMKNSPARVSLLGKVESVDIQNDDLIYIARKPFLIVPGASAEELEYINNWENKHTVYKSEKSCFFLPIIRRISEEKFYGLNQSKN